MAGMDGEKLLKEMDAFLDEQVHDDEDSGMPFEALEDYGTDPISFAEMSKRMMDKVDVVFDTAVQYNRHSPEYLKSCAQLEKGLKFLGAACRTKAALELEKLSSPELGQLTPDKLYRMASLHYKKIDRALSDFIEENHKPDDALLDMMYRYFNLLMRLRATENKIHRYFFQWRDSKTDYAPVVEGLAFSQKSWNDTFNRYYSEPAAFNNAPAFPLKDGNVVRAARSMNSAAAVEKIAAEIPALPEPAAAAADQGDLSANDSSAESTSPTKTEPAADEHPHAEARNDNEASDKHSLPVKQNDGKAAEPDLPGDIPAEDRLVYTEEFPFHNILLEAMKRTDPNLPENDEVVFTFTEEEKDQLLNDPLFLEIFPEMATELRKLSENSRYGP